MSFPAYDAVENLTAQTDEMGHTTAFEYDAVGRLTETTDAAGGVWGYTYDLADRLVTETDARGHTTSYDYDPMDRRTERTNALGGMYSWSCDAVGNLLSETNERNFTTSYTHDGADRLLMVTDALGGVRSYTHDAAGKVLTQTDPLGRITAYGYDAANHRVNAPPPNVRYVDPETFAPSVAPMRYWPYKELGEPPAGYVPPNAPSTARGYVIFGEMDQLGCPTGVRATITQEMIGSGSAAAQRIRPPGFGGQVAGHARGHLLGEQLGGSGTDPRNLVTIFQNPANHPTMSGFEAQVRAAVEAGQTVDYWGIPIYEGSNLIPVGVTLRARGSGGFSLDVSIINRGR